MEAGFLQHAAGGGVVGKRLREDSQNIRAGENIGAGLLYRIGGQPHAPVGFSDIVSQLGGSEMDIAAPVDADASGKTASGSDGVRKRLVGIGLQHFPDKCAGVFFRVRIGDAVPQVVHNVPVVQKLRQRSGIFHMPLSDRKIHACPPWASLLWDELFSDTISYVCSVGKLCIYFNVGCVLIE